MGKCMGNCYHLRSDTLQCNHKWLHDQLPCDMEWVDVVGAAECAAPHAGRLARPAPAAEVSLRKW